MQRNEIKTISTDFLPHNLSHLSYLLLLKKLNVNAEHFILATTHSGRQNDPHPKVFKQIRRENSKAIISSKY